MTANAALSAFTVKAKSWNASTTNAQALADAQPAIDALETADTSLTNDRWPGGTTADMHALIGKVKVVIGDLQDLATVSLAKASSFTDQLERDAGAEKAARNLVRHDLGLPPEPVGQPILE